MTQLGHRTGRSTPALTDPCQFDMLRLALAGGIEMRSLKRREFITLVGGAAVSWPLRAWAQQAAMPVVGFLDPRSPEHIAERLRGFRQGLKDAGYVEGENVAIVYRFAENQNDRLPELAGDLVRRQVGTIRISGVGTIG
jgi:putative ABC transport system substrate-binding protein